jgi:uncharacterized surface protein with fasciclin (FAS1) repeats
MLGKTNQMLRALMVGTGVLLMVACNGLEEIEPIQEVESELMDLTNTLISMENGEVDDGEFDEDDPNARRKFKKRGKRHGFATLNAALGATGLAKVLAQNELTVFAPTDEAFAELGLFPGNIRKVPNLKEILLYHVLEGSVFSRDLVEGFTPTVTGAAVEISLSEGPMVNDADIIRVDKRARNGVIHIIDKVLMPPTENLVGLASGNEDFSILVQAVVAADLVDALASGENLTVFAPTNDAFLQLLEDFGVGSLDELIDKIGKDLLRDVLLYHVVDGRVFSSDLVDGKVSTLLSETFKVDVSGPNLIDKGGNISNIIATDLQATNGVVHVIDRVILPL